MPFADKTSVHDRILKDDEDRASPWSPRKISDAVEAHAVSNGKARDIESWRIQTREPRQKSREDDLSSFVYHICGYRMTMMMMIERCIMAYKIYSKCSLISNEVMRCVHEGGLMTYNSSK